MDKEEFQHKPRL